MGQIPGDVTDEVKPLFYHDDPADPCGAEVVGESPSTFLDSTFELSYLEF